MLTRLYLLGALVLLRAAGGHGAQELEPERRTLTVLHTNDLQGRMLPQAYYDEEDRGGWARLVYLLHDLASRRNALVVDGGDALGPHILSQYDAGRLAIELMARGGYDAMVPGNHEFGFGIDTLKARAGSAPFPLLGANLRSATTGQPLFARYSVVERAGVRIGIVGLLSPGLVKVINPNRVQDIEIADPAQALRGVLEEIGTQVDYRIVLIHMPEEEAYGLAVLFPEVELFISGGFRRPETRGSEKHLLELAGGTRIVTVPERGPFLGRLDLVFAEEGGAWKNVDFRAELIPLDSTVPEDEETKALIDRQTERFRIAAARRLGQAAAPIEDTPQFVADLMRNELGAEVGIINMGALREQVLAGEISLGDVDQLIRFDDVLVVVEVTGKELQTMAASSQTRDWGGQRLVFSGYDADAGRINGRPLASDETYRVATTGYLAAGGDGYFAGLQVKMDGWRTLKEMVLSHIESYPKLGRGDGLERYPKGAWKNRAKISATLSRTGVNEHAGQYKGISFLSGKDAMAWSALVDDQLNYERAHGVFATRFRSSFGQVRHAGNIEEAADRLAVETVYTLQRIQPTPFISLDLNTVWTRPAGQERPLTLRGSSGLNLNRGEAFKMRLGLGVERDFADGTDAAGLELVPEYRRSMKKGNSFASTMKIFLGATQGHKLSIQHYNAVLVNLRGDLHVTVDANFFLHRDADIEELGLKSELQIGLGYTWEHKWL